MPHTDVHARTGYGAVGALRIRWGNVPVRPRRQVRTRSSGRLGPATALGDRARGRWWSWSEPWSKSSRARSWWSRPSSWSSSACRRCRGRRSGSSSPWSSSGGAVVLAVVLGDESSSLALTTASATPRPMTAATSTAIIALTPVLIPWRGGSSPYRPPVGSRRATSMRRVGSSCTRGSLERGADSADPQQCPDGKGEGCVLGPGAHRGAGRHARDQGREHRCRNPSVTRACPRSASALFTDDGSGNAATVWGSVDCADATRVRTAAGGDGRWGPGAPGRAVGGFRHLRVVDGDNFFGERCELGLNDPGSARWRCTTRASACSPSSRSGSRRSFPCAGPIGRSCSR